MKFFQLSDVIVFKGLDSSRLVKYHFFFDVDLFCVIFFLIFVVEFNELAILIRS